jgi:HSP20 family molecular chaperone IbpA
MSNGTTCGTTCVNQKQEAQNTQAERTRDRITFIPNTDIYKKGDALVVLVDMPGADQSTVDIQLEKGVLTITGHVDGPNLEGYQPIYTEYRYGDYQRSFTLSDEIDSEKIEASIKNGVLKLTLPIAEKAQAKKIAIKGN